MILDTKLNSNEIEILKEKFSEFHNSLNNLIRNSNLFTESKYLEGHFVSNTIYQGKFGSLDYKEHTLEISSRDYSDSVVDFFRWNSLEIRVIYVRKVKQIVGLFSKKEELDISCYHFFPMYSENEDSENDYYFGDYDHEYRVNNGYIQFKNDYEKKILITKDESNILNKIFEMLHIIVEEVRNENKTKSLELSNRKNSLIDDLDRDSNGQVDLIDGESFTKLLNKNQKIIIEIDQTYIQKFVKISLYLKTKKSNTQKIFDSIKVSKNDSELNELVNLLKNQIHSYELLMFHSISMITSLVESDLITFYEIYECFDQLGVFNSNWENEVSNKLNEVSDKLTDIGDGIRDLMFSIYHMENKIVNSIDNLTYVTQDSFKELNMSVNNQLSSIDSSIKFNNLLTGIQTYQMYKINQNTKRIN